MATVEPEVIKLPKYIQNANRIIETLAQQSDNAWTKTQRELGELLGFSQPELSTLLKLLFENDKIRRGAALPGVRGKNYVIELIDESPFTRPVSRKRQAPQHNEDRALEPGEQLSPINDLGGITVEKIGVAVMRALQESWEKEERHAQLRSEQMQRLREYREQMAEERRVRTQLARDKETLERRVHDMEHRENQLRSEINTLLVKANQKSGGSYQLRDLVSEESLRTLDNLMRGKPGYYRESDREVGVDIAS